VIFSRGRGNAGRHTRGEEARHSGRHAAGRRGADDLELSAEEELDAQDAVEQAPQGPYDISEAPAGVPRVDLGSLQIPALDGVEVRVQANPDGLIQQVVLVHGDSALQLGVFAAPRSAGIWDEVRAEIRASLFEDGVAVQEADGDHGTELQARVRTPEGLTDLRFLGIDGPRWMVRAVYQGHAATDPSAAGPLADCLAGLVVDRGREAMPARDALPLRLPREIAEQAKAEQGEAPPAPPMTLAPGMQLPATPPPVTPRAARPTPSPLGLPTTDEVPSQPQRPRPEPGGTTRRRPSPRPRRSR
jgi:hypothetical protein